MEFDRRDTHEEDRDVHPTNQDLHVIPSPKINGNHVGAPRQPAPDLSELEDIIPVNVGRLRLYEVGKQIGSGKFSVVFRARMADGRNVALKKIQIFNIMDAKSRNKCLREVHMLQSISQHENLIEYLDAFIEDNELMIVFEWAENGDLRRLLRKTQTPFEERQVWNYFVQVAGAISHMHDQRMMHRDIKPANIFVASNNVLKLGDLGLGRMLSNDSVEAFSKVGTPLYMSPEVLHGQGYDFKSDMWSLGCLLYELATLRSPFEAPNQTLYDIFKRINSCDFPPLPDTLSQELRDLVSRMLQSDPKRRPTAAEALAYAQMACAALQGRPSGLMLMQDLLDKCKLLDYQSVTGLPLLTRCFFSGEDITAATAAAASDIKFPEFVRMAVWLLQLNGCRVALPDGSPLQLGPGHPSEPEALKHWTGPAAPRVTLDGVGLDVRDASAASAVLFQVRVAHHGHDSVARASLRVLCVGACCVRGHARRCAEMRGAAVHGASAWRKRPREPGSSRPRLQISVCPTRTRVPVAGSRRRVYGGTHTSRLQRVSAVCGGRAGVQASGAVRLRLGLEPGEGGLRRGRVRPARRARRRRAAVCV
jgi:serine/threonine protein kinase